MSRNALAKQENADPVVMSDSEQEIASFLDDLEEFLQTPFVQALAVATVGTPFTIIKCGTRLTNKLGTEEEITQLLYMVQLEDDLQYLNKTKEKKEFKKGDVVLLAVTDNKTRRTVWEATRQTIETHGPIPHMAAREVPPSKRAAALGMSPSISICHKSKWRSLEA